jgi:hypothetical protein
VPTAVQPSAPAPAPIAAPLATTNGGAEASAQEGPSGTDRRLSPIGVCSIAVDLGSGVVTADRIVVGEHAKRLAVRRHNGHDQASLRRGAGAYGEECGQRRGADASHAALRTRTVDVAGDHKAVCRRSGRSFTGSSISQAVSIAFCSAVSSCMATSMGNLATA